MTIPVTIEVSASTTVPIPVTLTVAERGPKGEIGLTGPAGADSTVPGPKGDPGPTAVSTDAGQLATLGTDNLLLVSSDDVATAAQGALADSAVQPDDLTWAALTDTATDEASDGQVWTADGAGGAAWEDQATPAAAGTKTLAVFTPMTSQPPASNFATLDTRNSIAVLDFDDGATNEATTFVGIIPEGADLSSGILVRIFWMATSATSGACRWGVQFEKYGTDNDADSFDTATEGHTTTSGTSGIAVVTELTATSIDSLAAGDQYRLKVYRDSSDTTNDTMTGDAELIAVEVRGVA